MPWPPHPPLAQTLLWIIPGRRRKTQVDERPEGMSNWLPAPPGGFQLMVRAYQPRENARDYSYTPPAPEIVGQAQTAFGNSPPAF